MCHGGAFDVPTDPFDITIAADQTPKVPRPVHLSHDSKALGLFPLESGCYPVKMWTLRRHKTFIWKVIKAVFRKAGTMEIMSVV